MKTLMQSCIALARVPFARLAFARFAFPRRAFARLAFARRAFARLAFARLAFARLAFARLAFARLAFGRLAFGRLAFSRRAFAPLVLARSAVASASARAALIAVGALAAAGTAQAWGDVGHEVTALIAYRHLTPTAKKNLDALLAADPDTLTKKSFAARATWADQYRNAHRETANWHFVDIEIDSPDLQTACFNFPALPAGTVASQGTADDCVVNKIEEFFAELKDPATPQAERLMALKFLIHFVGDLHQPLHASDHHDRGGNCIGLSPPLPGTGTNLHAYWDVGAVLAIGKNAADIARTLDVAVTDAKVKSWDEGNPRTWAMESFELSKSDVYDLPSLPTCDAAGSVALTAAYQKEAAHEASRQLTKAGVRLAGLLNQALGEQLPGPVAGGAAAAAAPRSSFKGSSSTPRNFTSTEIKSRSD